MDKLKDCLCGGKPTIRIFQSLGNIEIMQYELSCRKCNIGYPLNPDKNELIAMWNARPKVDVEGIAGAVSRAVKDVSAEICVNPRGEMSGDEYHKIIVERITEAIAKHLEGEQ